ncbi:MAG: hypothetical protein V4819_16275 [Verrucomicrobiota bacterium]
MTDQVKKLNPRFETLLALGQMVQSPASRGACAAALRYRVRAYNTGGYSDYSTVAGLADQR